MGKLVDILRRQMEGEHFRLLPCSPVNLDIERYSEYRDSDQHPAERPFEEPAPAVQRILVRDVPRGIPSILRFFLDGSRRTYKFLDVICEGRYLPVIAGQVGVAVVERAEGATRVHPLREFCALRCMLAFPDRVSKEDIRVLQDTLNRSMSQPFMIVRYTCREGRDPVDLGVARIMSEMHDMEIAAVLRMAAQNMLRNDSVLVIDGPLRFKKKFDLVQFRNVIGLSKTFRPSFTVGRGRKKKDVGTLASTLAFGQRTTAFRTKEEEKTIGMWYLRIRPQEHMGNYLEGVVKAECYAFDAEIENGLDGEKIDTISAHILRERNVTPYKSDLRWASHIYPVYQAETFLKASFMSDTHFRALLT